MAKYDRYLDVIRKYNPDGATKHERVAAGARECAAVVKDIPDRIKRMEEFLKCMHDKRGSFGSK